MLGRLRSGDEKALHLLVETLYDDLRQMARRHLRQERPGHTFNPTDLVNEMYLKLVQQRQLHTEDRTQFLAFAGHLIHRILVDYARKKKSKKRGEGQAALPLDEAGPLLSDQEADEVLALHEALSRLARVNPRGSQIVEYRFFSGLTLGETADVMGLSVKTVQRAWQAALAWLRKEVALDLSL